jgi:hypothetical protein
MPLKNSNDSFGLLQMGSPYPSGQHRNTAVLFFAGNRHWKAILARSRHGFPMPASYILP